MTTRDVRDLIVQAWAGELCAAGCRAPDATALKLAVIAESHGLKFTRPAHLHDPAADYHDRPEPAAPGADYLAARKALRAADTTTDQGGTR